MRKNPVQLAAKRQCGPDNTQVPTGHIPHMPVSLSVTLKWSPLSQLGSLVWASKCPSHTWLQSRPTLALWRDPKQSSRRKGHPSVFTKCCLRRPSRHSGLIQHRCQRALLPSVWGWRETPHRTTERFVKRGNWVALISLTIEQQRTWIRPMLAKLITPDLKAPDWQLQHTS